MKSVWNFHLSLVKLVAIASIMDRYGNDSASFLILFVIAAGARRVYFHCDTSLRLSASKSSSGEIHQSWWLFCSLLYLSLWRAL